MHRFANPLRYQRIADAVLRGPWGSRRRSARSGCTSRWSWRRPTTSRARPTDHVRHVPAAWMALMVYAMMAGASVASLVWRHPLAEVAGGRRRPSARRSLRSRWSPASLWGKPMWGTFWVWDARLTSVLILLFLYLGYIALLEAFDDPGRGARAAAILSGRPRSTCRSSSSRSTGGTRPRRPRSCGPAGRQ